jgi:hypothetical protein
MAAPSVTIHEMPPLEEFLKTRRRRGYRSSTTQLLWNKLEADTSLYILSRSRDDLTPQDLVLLEQCRQQLQLAQDAIDRRGKRPFSFWEIIHEVDGLLLLVLPKAMLPSRALVLQQRFEAKIKDPIIQRLWLGADRTSGPLPKASRLLNEALASGPPHVALPSLDDTRLAHCRHVLRGALGVLNDHVDRSFWQLSINVTIQILSTLLLMWIFLLALLIPILFPSVKAAIEGTSEFLPWGLIICSVIGMGGAILSNMLSKERFVVAMGATVRYFVYYLFVKPIIGAVAALLLVLLDQSGQILGVVVETSKDANNPALTPAVQINVDTPTAAFLVRTSLSLVAGFFADRVLSSVMDRVLGRLLKDSEKAPAPPPLPQGSTSFPDK